MPPPSRRLGNLIRFLKAWEGFSSSGLGGVGIAQVSLIHSNSKLLRIEGIRGGHTRSHTRRSYVNFSDFFGKHAIRGVIRGGHTRPGFLRGLPYVSQPYAKAIRGIFFDSFFYYKILYFYNNNNNNNNWGSYPLFLTLIL